MLSEAASDQAAASDHAAASDQTAASDHAAAYNYAESYNSAQEAVKDISVIHLLKGKSVMMEKKKSFQGEMKQSYGSRYRVLYCAGSINSEGCLKADNPCPCKIVISTGKTANRWKVS